MVNVGVIGCGWAGEKHVEAYSLLSEAEVVALADVDRGRAERLARRFKVESYHQDYRRILEDPRVEAVSICLPHYLHSKVTVEAAEAGKHVLCEKPMAARLDEADRMIEAAEKAGVVLMIAENVRFHPVNLKLKELVEEGVVGDVFLARIFRDHRMYGYLRERPWLLDKGKAGGGIWLAGGIHDVDALRMIVGEVDSVILLPARKVFLDMEGEDTVAALLRFEDGAVGVVTGSFSTRTFKPLSPLGCPSIVNGSAGTITVSSDGTIEVYSERIGNEDRCLKVKVEDKNTFLEEAKHFVECIRTGRKPVTSGEEERRTLAVICAGYESMRRGGIPVKVRY